MEVITYILTTILAIAATAAGYSLAVGETPPREIKSVAKIEVYPRGFRCRLRSPLRRWLLTLQNPFDQSFCSRWCLWGCGRRRAFPRFPSWLGKRGSADGRQRRSSTYPQAFVVNLARRVVAEALVLALFVIEAEPGANAGLCLGDTGIGMQVDLLILQTAPQPLDEDVVHTAAFAIHADCDTAPIEHCDELDVGELAALVGVEDLRPAVSGQRFLQGLDAEVRAERVRQ